MRMYNAPGQMEIILAQLQDRHLIESFNEAKRLKLESEFVELLRSEIARRGIAADTMNYAVSH